MTKSKEELLELVSQLETVIDNLPFNVWLKDEAGNYLVVNKKFEESSRKTKEEIIGANCYEVFAKSQAKKCTASDKRVIDGEMQGYYEEEYKKGKYKETFKKTVKNDVGEIVGIFGFSKDITLIKKTQDALVESERSKAALLANLPGLAYLSDNDSEFTMTYISESCLELTGYTAEQLINKKPSYYSIIHPDYVDDLFKRWREEALLKTILNDEYPIITATGKIKWVFEQSQEILDAGRKLIATEGFIIDVTERKLAEEKILYLSYHDQLTGLYNRRFYEEELVRLDTERNLPLTLIMGDINGLKAVNDSLGHAVGDALIRKVAEFIKNGCRADEIIARIGGDEFVVLLPKTDSVEAEQIIGRINDLLSEKSIAAMPISIAFGQETKVTRKEEIEDIFRMAEAKMYKNKVFQMSLDMLAASTEQQIQAGK